MEKISVVMSISFEEAATMMKDGEITNYDNFSSIPETFKEVIRAFMSDNIGYETGPIFCLARINGDSVSLQGNHILDGDIKIADLLPTGPGDVLLEFAIKVDSITTIGVNKFLLLSEQAKEFGYDNDIILEDLRDSLSVGIDTDEENVFCFLSKLSRKECVRYVLIDEEWKTSYKSAFKDIEEVKLSTLSIF